MHMHICVCVCVCVIKMSIFPGCFLFFIYWGGVFQTQGLPIAVSLASEFSPGIPCLRLQIFKSGIQEAIMSAYHAFWAAELWSSHLQG